MTSEIQWHESLGSEPLLSRKHLVEPQSTRIDSSQRYVCKIRMHYRTGTRSKCVFFFTADRETL
jgi:hypothetical protein